MNKVYIVIGILPDQDSYIEGVYTSEIAANNMRLFLEKDSDFMHYIIEEWVVNE